MSPSKRFIYLSLPGAAKRIFTAVNLPSLQKCRVPKVLVLISNCTITVLKVPFTQARV
jgi:hypothetical protein